MKKLYTIVSLLLIYCTSFAQKIDSTINISADTINVYGKVVYENGEAIANALIVTNSPSYINFNTSTRTDKEGNFKLAGIKPICNFWIYSENGNLYFTNNSSRYLFIKVPFLKANQLVANSFGLIITAKRIKDKPKIELKQIAKTDMSFGHIESPASYPHGLAKFYTYIKESIVYPTAAINNNIEGNVTVEFIVDKNGFIKAPVLLRDIGYGCGEQLIKVLKQSKKWNAAMQAGKWIDTRFSLEVPFQLID